MATSSGEYKLQKHIGFLGLLAMNVGLNIGGALFALTTLAASMAGPSLPLAMLISAVPALLAIVPYSILTSAMPTTSATYRYVQLVNPTLALVCLLTMAVCICIGGQPLYALAFGIYLKELIPVPPVVSGLCVLTFFYLVNLLGVRLTARFQSLLFFLLLAALLLYVFLGIPHVSIENLKPLFPKGVQGMLAASGLLFTFCSGGFFVVDLGGEVSDARRIFPMVLAFGMLIAVALYVAILLVTVGVIPWNNLKGKSLIVVAQAFMGRRALTFFIVGGALTASATTINIVYSIVSRGFMVLAGDGLFPRLLGHVSDRFRTPHWGLTFAWLVSAIALVGIPSLMFFGSMLNLGLIFAVTLVAVAALVLPKRFPLLYARSSLKIQPGLAKMICWAVIGFNTLIFLFFTVAIGWASVVFGGIALAAYLYALSHKQELKQIKVKVREMQSGRFQGQGVS